MSAGAIFNKYAIAPSSIQKALLLLLAFITSFTSSLAWKVSDVDFAAKLGANYLEKAYIVTALLLFIGAAFFLTLLKKNSPQHVFFIFQKYSLLFFGSITFLESFFHISQHGCVVYIFKVFGYAYSSLILHAFWISLDLYNKRSSISTGQCALIYFSTYLGMASAGVLLQSSTVGASQFGIIGGSCSFLCWVLAKNITQASYIQQFYSNEQPVQQMSSPKALLKAVCTSHFVLLLIIGSVLLNVLISSTEYSVIADFESRFMTTPESATGNQTIGSFVALIGVGNIFTLFSLQLCARFKLGRAGVSFAAILAFLTVRCGFSEGHSLLLSALALVVMESLYPLVVESNLTRLLEYFPEQQRLSARTLLSTITEPAGLILSAGLLSMSWVNVSTFGIGVIIVSVLISVFSYTIEGKWLAYFSMLRQKRFVFAARASTFLILCQAIIPWAKHSEQIIENRWTKDIEWSEPPL